MNKKLNAQILEKYLKMTARQLNQCIIKDDEIQINCNICGDSEHKNKLRGHIKLGESGDSWFYKCFNGGCAANSAWSALKWLKETDIYNYKNYCKEVLDYNNDEKKTYNNDPIITPVKKKEPDVKFYLNQFKPINYSNDLIYRKAQYQCEQRKIPKKYYMKFMVCPEGSYYDRMIIPFYDQNDEIYYFQARTLSNKEPKYLNMKGRKDSAIYNLYNIKTDQPVVVTEGPIDSLFIDNAIATLGLEVSSKMQKILDKLDCYYLFDNDKPGRQQAKKYHQKGYNIFIWEKFKYYNKKNKDINDVVKNNDVIHFSFEDLRSCFENSYSDYRYYLGKY